jgi:CBS-domain-containing membrane protein
MTRSVASATTKTPISQVASLMRDLNIGDVLVIDDGKLRGIVTDRDLAIHGLTNGATTSTPVEKYMSTDVVTGAPDWSVEQLADVMGKNQVRRLPIVQDGTVVGIVSLGDLAVHAPKRETVGKSLKNISEATRTRFRQSSPLTKFISIAIPVALGAAALAFANTKSGQQVRKQLSSQLNNSELADQARHIINDAVETLQNPRTRQAALDALDATGLPERTRQVIHDGVRTIQDPRTRERAMNMADETRRQAMNLPDSFTRRFQKPKPKRFLFA